MIYLISLLGLGLRLISLNQSLWLDEAVQIWASSLPLNEFFHQFLPGDFNPPFYYFFLHFWIKLFGNSEISARLPSIIFGILSVFLLVEIAKLLGIKKKESQNFLALLFSTSFLLFFFFY